jgi:hypothetical protein
MSHLFGQQYDYGRFGLMAVGIGMGLHLTAGTFNQAALARGQARTASGIWLAAAALFLIWTVVPVVDDLLLRVEVGYLGATALLASLMYGLYVTGHNERLPALPTVRPADRPLMREPAGEPVEQAS